jgi:hypothetical protein
VTAAAHVLSDDRELGILAKSVQQQIGAAAKSAVTQLDANAQDLDTLLAALYACLATGDSRLKADTLKALPPQAQPTTPLAVVALAARGLLGEGLPIEDVDRASWIASSVSGDADVTVLAGLACRRADGGVWSAYRVAMRDTLGRQPLPGSVVVLLNRLSGHMPQLVSR